MARRIRFDLITILFAVTALVVAVAALATPALAGLVLPSDTTTTDSALQEQALSLPLAFIENQGQAPDDVRFHVSAAGHMIAFAPDRIVLSASQDVNDTTRSAEVTMTFPGSSAAPAIAGLDRMPGNASFFLGNDASKWQEGVPIFGSIEYRQLYPGIDLRYRGTQGVLKREFVVAAGSKPDQIAIAYEGIDALALAADGSLAITTSLGVLTDEAPVAYQVIDGVKVPVTSSYRLKDDGTVGFTIGVYDQSRPLVIDPTLLYSSFYWGAEGSSTGTSLERVRVGSTGNIYVAGFTDVTNLPVQNANQGSNGGSNDAFVAELNPEGNQVLYLSYLGGSASDNAVGLSVDSAGNIYLCGGSESTDFPLQSAFQSTIVDFESAFVTKLNPSNPPGSQLVFSTYLSGSGGDMTSANAIVVGPSGDVYVSGYTDDTDLPITPGAAQPASGGGFDAYLAKFSSAGSLTYLTYLGGSGDEGIDIAYVTGASAPSMGLDLDSTGNVYIAGETGSSDFPIINALQASYGGGDCDGFVAKYSSAGSRIYATYLGGLHNDVPFDLAVDGEGAAYIAGTTRSTNFPMQNPAQGTLKGMVDNFVTKLDASGAALDYSTYWGSADAQWVGLGIAVNNAGEAYIAGHTLSTDFQSINPTQPSYGGGPADGFVAKFSAAGNTVLYSTYLGGAAWDQLFGIALNLHGDAVVVGNSASSNYPTTASAYEATQPGDWKGVLSIFAEAGTPPAPTADFSANVTNGTAPLAVAFSDASTGDAITARAWDFQDDGTVDSTDENPTFMYTAAGNYTVNLTVTNDAGSDSEVRTDYIRVTEPVTITPTPTPTVAPESGVLSAPRHIFVAPSNGAKYDLDGAAFGGPSGTYYIKADGGGLNEMHITNSIAAPSGQVTSTSSQSGTFWVTNTGGRGFDDDILLLVSVQGDLPDDFAVHVKSSGYTWTPTIVANQLPTGVQYTTGAVDRTFTKADFAYGPQTWKPGPGDLVTPSLPLWTGQNIADQSTAAHLMFVDLKVGNLYPSKSAEWTSAVDNGGAKVEYSFTNMSSVAAFNGYGWCLAANQGQGISWTNRVEGSGNSAYSVVYAAPTPTVTETPTVTPTTPAVVQVPNGTGLPTDTNGDGLYDDLNGNGRRDFGDVVLYFNQMTWIEANEPLADFDCNGNGRIDFADVVWFFNHL